MLLGREKERELWIKLVFDYGVDVFLEILGLMMEESEKIKNLGGGGDGEFEYAPYLFLLGFMVTTRDQD